MLLMIEKNKKWVCVFMKSFIVFIIMVMFGVFEKEYLVVNKIVFEDDGEGLF